MRAVPRSPPPIKLTLFSTRCSWTIWRTAACRDGNENAWRQFLAGYHVVAEGAARSLMSDAAAAGELADSLYGLRQTAARAIPLSIATTGAVRFRRGSGP